MEIAIAIVIASLVYAYASGRFNIKPRLALYQLTVLGRTEENETLQISFPVFVDETPKETADKLNGAFKLREDRLQFQNQRLIKLQEEQMKLAEEAKKLQVNPKIVELQKVAEEVKKS